MAIETIFCPACNNKLRVPDDLMGQEVQCPKCQTMFVAPPPPGAVMPADHPEAPPRRLPASPAGFDDDAADRWDDEPRRAPVGPNPMPAGVCLLVVSILGLLSGGLRLGLAIGAPDQLKKIMANNPMFGGGGMPAGLDIVMVVLVAGIIFTAMSLLSLAGAMCMIRRKLWGLAVAGCFLAMFNPTDGCCILGLPVGIWGLVVLFNENTKRSFS